MPVSAFKGIKDGSAESRCPERLWLIRVEALGSKGKTLLDTVEAYSSLSLCLEPQVSLSSKEPTTILLWCMCACMCVHTHIWCHLSSSTIFHIYRSLTEPGALEYQDSPPQIPHYFHSFWDEDIPKEQQPYLIYKRPWAILEHCLVPQMGVLQGHKNNRLSSAMWLTGILSPREILPVVCLADSRICTPCGAPSTGWMI